jgi:2-C-methyl-D-erythritol 4-phosphate cytidylyltransferase
MCNTFSCIITAGGSGTRFDATHKKQFFEISNKPIINNTIEIFYPIEQVREIIVTLPEDDFQYFDQKLVSEYPNKLKCIIGGVTRQESVLNALNICNEKNEFVMIHDAVRPLLRKSDLLQMMSLVVEYDAVILGSRVKNTIKRVDKDLVVDTIKRDNLIEVYTPQLFRLNKIKDFHIRAKDINNVFTDDASIFEYFDEPVHWYETDVMNIKITTKEDLLLVKSLMN